MLVLVTGAAGFIGFHTARRLLVDGHTVIGLDSLNDYYDVRLKHSRLAILREFPQFTFVKMQLEDRAGIARIFSEHRFDRVIHLGAQAGVAYSMENPEVYATANLVGFLHILEGCRRNEVPHLVYASSSSVYGANTRMPFTVHDGVDHPLSLYGATKRANELMAHSYSHLYGVRASGLRFFTVYGEYGRPDMVFFLFTKAILEGRAIDVYNFGDMKRDFTYIDDVVESIVRVMDVIPSPDPGWSHDIADAATSMAPFRLYNVGNSEPVHLLEVIDLLEQAIGKKAIRNLLPIRPGDVPATYADASCLEGATTFKPSTHVREGIPKFVAWYLEHYAGGTAKIRAS
jgi:UDP-glucuronate 4-epimerase